jgi:hypothetical protein
MRRPMKNNDFEKYLPIYFTSVCSILSVLSVSSFKADKV